MALDTLYRSEIHHVETRSVHSINHHVYTRKQHSLQISGFVCDKVSTKSYGHLRLLQSNKFYYY